MGEIKKKIREPALSPAQIGIYIFVQIIGLIQGLLPLINGDDFDVYWFIFSFILDNIAYLLILWLRGVISPEGAENAKSQLLEYVGNKITEILGIIKSTPKEDLQPALERILIWTVRELDVLYQEEMKKFTDYINTEYLGDKVEPFRVKEKESSKTELELLRDSLRELNGDIEKKHPEIKQQIVTLEAKLEEIEKLEKK